MHINGAKQERKSCPASGAGMEFSVGVGFVERSEGRMNGFWIGGGMGDDNEDENGD